MQLSKPIKLGDTKNESSCRLWALLDNVLILGYWVITCNKCATFVQDVNDEETMRGGREGKRIYGNSVYFLVNFSVNIKLL